MPMDRDLRASLEEAAATLDAFLADAPALAATARFAELLIGTVERGGRILVCGNGGSMTDAMHFAEEWTGRFRRDRRAVPALALSDPAVMSCIANDFGFDEVFARPVEAHGRTGDLLVVLSTSGSSPNLVRAAGVARERGIATAGLLGRGGGKLLDLVDVAVVVPYATSPDRVQEIHAKVLHAVTEAVERRLFPDLYAGDA